MNHAGTMRVRADYYQQFDADPARDVPGEGYGGWRTAEFELSLEHTAVVVMHAWDCGTPEQYPGWYRCEEHILRTQAIADTIFPPLLAAVRSSPLPLFHVITGCEKSRDTPGYRHAVALSADLPDHGYPLMPADPVLESLHAFKKRHAYVGAHNEADVRRGFQNLDFMPAARPLPHEGIAATWRHLYALCRERNINHLIYMGFAINWCLLLSPGGMADMHKVGIMCSAFRQAVTAIENRESARTEAHKEEGLWRVALSYGFIFDVDPFVAALNRLADRNSCPPDAAL